MLTNFLSQFYILWVAVLIKQVIKDPIHRLSRYKHFYNVLTIIICLILTGIISIANNFGVEVRTLLFKCIVGNIVMRDDDYSRFG